MEINALRAKSDKFLVLDLCQKHRHLFAVMVKLIGLHNDTLTQIIPLTPVTPWLLERKVQARY